MKYLLIVLLFSAFAKAQTYVDDQNLVNGGNLQTENAQLNVATTTTQQNAARGNTTQNNSVFIAQVGVNNLALTNVASNNAEVNITQSGSYNLTDLRINSLVVRQNVNQNGVGNQYYNYSTQGNLLNVANVNQEGNYNTTISVGNNSVTERVRVNQQGIGSTVYVLHY
ncbi:MULTISPECIES: hypothetical protein [Nonlabens]|uniref:hypothetical protein n=1 Tax=Nonlabens TaxID=363408 RepID=UPI000CF5648F|nr:MULTISPECIES: hypothetical protein [Nonlabens]PQJ18430.1 hypothetical protein BST93_08050 [Nonlabens tegetincola]